MQRVSMDKFQARHEKAARPNLLFCTIKASHLPTIKMPLSNHHKAIPSTPFFPLKRSSSVPQNCTAHSIQTTASSKGLSPLQPQRTSKDVPSGNDGAYPLSDIHTHTLTHSSCRARTTIRCGLSLSERIHHFAQKKGISSSEILQQEDTGTRL